MTVDVAPPTRPHRRPLPFRSGEFVVCTLCSYTFDEKGSSQDCPRCGASCAWLEEHESVRDRDRRAAEIDPAQVAQELAYCRRVIRDRASREAAGIPA